ncbi:unnamed protein product [Acanthoscelides obtectus]|uniref:C2H2-type domain-containing protein n=1 Tax=Acanthoscelides obtectus TaxID=200917 RepID=A0A9P0LM87_ACAOB|nr:unnamed protein product [Acanthoscelides obtectus]CAK1626575.1 Zinc finger protein 710 [Acanthoscelides obtectus]
MDSGNKKIKLDPDLVKGRSQQNPESDEDDIFEETVEPCDENIEVEAEHCLIKYEDQEPVDATEYMVEISADLQEMINDSTPQFEDETKNEDSTVKSDKRAINGFICNTCNFITTEPLDFTNHWLSHETRTYTYQNGVYVCHISHCLNVLPSKKELLKHVALQHLSRYRCSFCYYVTYSNEDFDEHSSNHYTYQCVKCDLQSTKHFFVQNHLATPLECELCDFKAYHWITYQKHINLHRYPPDSIIECRYCGFATGDKNLHKKHLTSHFGNFIFCKMCDFNVGENSADLDNHYKNSHNTTLDAVRKMRKCKFCTCKFINPEPKDMHEKLHLKKNTTFKCCTNSTTVQCPYCRHDDINIDEHILSKHSAEFELEGVRFESNDDESVIKVSYFCKTEDEQEKFTAEHNDAIPISDDNADDQEIEDAVVIDADKVCRNCPKCQRIFKGMKAFEKHLSMEHNISYAEAIRKSKISLLCEFCGYSTFKLSTLKEHFIADHSNLNKSKPKMEPKLIPNNRRYICPFCYDVTFAEHEFEAHCQTHTIFKCTECHFESTKRLFVEDHMDNPWACSKCEFRSHHWLPLKNHSVNQHDTITPLYRCKECNFETRKLRLLKTHRFTHSWAFIQCTICTYRTGSEDAIKSHYEKCHDCNEPGGVKEDVDRPYECEFCDCKFKRETFLDRHRALHGANGPFNVKCSQCHNSNTSVSKYDNGKDTNGDGWTKCPYCAYKDEARYKMFDHLSQIHENELEIEGFRYRETTNKLYEETANTEKPAKRRLAVTANTQPQKQKKKVYEKPKISTDVVETNRDHLECTATTSSKKTNTSEASSSRAKLVKFCPICPFFTVRREEFLKKHIHSKHCGYKCDICGHTTKGIFTNAHMDEKRPQLTLGAESSNEPKILFCPVCGRSRRHVFTQNVAELQEENLSVTDDDYKVKEEVTESDDVAFEEADTLQEDADSIKRSTEEPDDIAQAVALQVEGADKIQQPNEEFEDNAYSNISQESGDIAQADTLKDEDAVNIHQPIEKIEIKEEMIAFEKIPHTVFLKEENPDSVEKIEIKVEATDVLGLETVEGITTADAACASSRNSGQNEQKPRRKGTGPFYCQRDKRWHCPFCDYNGMSSYYAAQHCEQIHKGDQNLTFRCSICCYETRSWRFFSDHINLKHVTEAGPEEIPCKQTGCDYKAPSVDELSKHLARHLQSSIKDLMKYKCKLCNFATVSENIFKNHKCISKTCLECYECGFKGETKMRIYSHILKRHTYTYSQKKGYQCRRCGRNSHDETWRERHFVRCPEM